MLVFMFLSSNMIRFTSTNDQSQMTRDKESTNLILRYVTSLLKLIHLPHGNTITFKMTQDMNTSVKLFFLCHVHQQVHIPITEILSKY